MKQYAAASLFGQEPEETEEPAAELETEVETEEEPQEGEMGEVPTDPDLEAQGEVTDAQAQKDARKAEI